MATTSSESPQLDYAPAPPTRRRWLRRSFLLLVILAAVFVAWRFGPSMAQQARLLYRERACLNYSASPDQVVYEEDPTLATKLLISGSEYTTYPIHRAPQANQNPPPAFTAAAHVPACWWAYPTLIGPSMMQASRVYGAIAFLHERLSPGGNHRLVCIRCFPDPSTFVAQPIDGFNYDSTVVTRATLTQRPKVAMRIYTIDVISGWPKHPPNMRIYAGQIDPNDPSHFTIRYEMWGQTDVLDGYLDDNDRVTLKPRQLPEDR
jgi:hypothetical protein